MSKRFEELQVRSLAFDLMKKLSVIFYDPWFKNWWFQDQIMRATLSISNNIAEWYERETKKEFIRFLYIARGSSGEVRSMIHVAESLWYIDENQSKELQNDCITISVKLHNFIQHLTDKP